MSGLDDDGLIDDNEDIPDENVNEKTTEDSVRVLCTGLSTEQLHEENQLRLMSIMSVWNDPTTRDARVSFAILLPSGIPGSDCSNDEFDDGIELKVDGLELILTIKWPSTMTCVSELCALWLRGEEGKVRLENYHPMIEGFNKHLEEFKKNSNDTV